MSNVDDFERKVHKYIEENNMLSVGDKIVIGVSGGADSICLLKIFLSLAKSYKLQLYVVHVHHGIRGNEADEDEGFVREFCNDYKEYIVYKAFYYNVIAMAKEKKMSEEEVGRLVRYESFEKIMKSVAADKIAVAHNLNDNVETVIFNICRGTGISGLKGIVNKSDKLIRPLLCVTREEIESYLQKCNQSYRQDRTNFEEEYTRNRIRLNVIPYLESNINSNVKEHINSLASIAYETEKFMDSYVNKLYYDIVSRKEVDGEISFSINNRLLLEQEYIIRQRIIRKTIYMLVGKLKDISNLHIEDILKLSDKNVGKQIVLPYSIICRKNYEHIEFFIENAVKEPIVSRLYEKVELGKPYYLEYYDKNIIFECINKEKNANIPQNNYTKWFDYDKINGDIVLRNRENGDKMQLNPKGTTKKLKDLMIDLKINKNERDNIPLVAWDSNVLWLVGKRNSEAYRVDEDTKRILQIKVY